MKNKLKSFRQFTEENSKTLYFTFGRFQPPTIGHAKLFKTLVSAAKGNDYKIYTSQSQDGKTNPLSYEEKVKFLRKMFPKYARNIILDNKLNTLFAVADKAYKDGYTKLVMLAGGDRIPEYKALLPKYQGVKGRHGFYDFPEGIEFVSAGKRDPDSDDPAEAMSGTKMRKIVKSNDFSEFSKVMPKGFGQAKELFNAVRKGLGLKESHDLRTHVDLSPIPIRERYVRGEVFNVGDIVINKKNDIKYEIIERFTNHVTVKSTIDDSEIKLFITDLNEVYEIGTDEYRKHTEDMTPGQMRNEDNRERIPKGKLILRKDDGEEWYQFYVGRKPLVTAGGDTPRNAVANLEMYYNTDGLDLKPFWR